MPKDETPRIYTRYNPAPITKCDCSNKPVTVYGWQYNEKTHQPEPVAIGERDPQADIIAARTETLTEMMARMPGKNPLERLQSAVNAGIIVPPVKEGKVADLRAVKGDLVENMETLAKGSETYKGLGIDKLPGKNPMEKLMSYLHAEIEKAKAAPAPAQEGEKHE